MKRKIKESDFDHIADYIVEEKKRREKNRKDLDAQIKEIDRQVEMRPDRSHKLNPDGSTDPDRAWLPEIELPLQAEALETLAADTRSMQFPDAGSWFAAHSALDDEYFDRIGDDGFASIIAGDKNEVPTIISQDNADKLAIGFLNYFHRQYDFRGNVDIINAEALSYGVGIGRARMVSKSVVRNTARGLVRENQRIPVLVPRSLKETLLDDRSHILMHEGFMVGPLTIFKTKKVLSDVMQQAKKGGSDAEKEDGGWRPSVLKKLEADDKGCVELIEAEGDFVIPRKTTGDIRLPNTIITVASGKNKHKVVRVRFKEHEFNSVLEFHYNKENAQMPYGSSPLRKGMPLQAAAVESLMRVVEVSALNARPPVGYDRNDMWFAEMGGPIIEPGRLWGTIGDLNIHQIGDPAALNAIYIGFLSQYADAVGVHRARLGAQTVSHTTAFAKKCRAAKRISEDGRLRPINITRPTLSMVRHGIQDGYQRNEG